MTRLSCRVPPTGGRRAAVQIGGQLIAFGALVGELFGALVAVSFLVEASWWWSTGWGQQTARS